MFYVDSAKCTGCGACIEVCAEEDISLKDDRASINQNLCAGCGSCMDTCATGAIYQVEAPVVASEHAPVIVSRPSVVGKKQTSVVATLVSVAPAAIDVLSRLARRWLALREEQINIPVARPGRGAGRHRRWQGGRR